MQRSFYAAIWYHHQTPQKKKLNFCSQTTEPMFVGSLHTFWHNYPIWVCFQTVAFCLSWVSPLIVVYIVSPIPAIVPRSLFRVGIELSLGRTVGFRDRFTDVPYSCHFIMTSLYFFSALGIFCTELSRALRN